MADRAVGSVGNEVVWHVGSACTKVGCWIVPPLVCKPSTILTNHFSGWGEADIEAGSANNDIKLLLGTICRQNSGLGDLVDARELYGHI